MDIEGERTVQTFYMVKIPSSTFTNMMMCVYNICFLGFNHSYDLVITLDERTYIAWEMRVGFVW